MSLMEALSGSRMSSNLVPNIQALLFTPLLVILPWLPIRTWVALTHMNLKGGVKQVMLEFNTRATLNFLGRG